MLLPWRPKKKGGVRVGKERKGKEKGKEKKREKKNRYYFIFIYSINLREENYQAPF
jgi:hypothetical protein